MTWVVCQSGHEHKHLGLSWDNNASKANSRPQIVATFELIHNRNSLQNLTTSDADTIKSQCTKVFAENLIMHINWTHSYFYKYVHKAKFNCVFLSRLRTQHCIEYIVPTHPTRTHTIHYTIILYIHTACFLHEIPLGIHSENAKTKNTKTNKLYLQLGPIDQLFQLVRRFASIHFL